MSYLSEEAKEPLQNTNSSHDQPDLLENAFAPLSDDDYEVAMKRVRELLDLEFDAESMKEGANELMWAVIAAFSK